MQGLERVKVWDLTGAEARRKPTLVWRAPDFSPGRTGEAGEKRLLVGSSPPAKAGGSPLPIRDTDYKLPRTSSSTSTSECFGVGAVAPAQGARCKPQARSRAERKLSLHPPTPLSPQVLTPPKRAARRATGHCFCSGPFASHTETTGVALATGFSRAGPSARTPAEWDRCKSAAAGKCACWASGASRSTGQSSPATARWQTAP